MLRNQSDRETKHAKRAAVPWRTKEITPYGQIQERDMAKMKSMQSTANRDDRRLESAQGVELNTLEGFLESPSKGF